MYTGIGQRISVIALFVALFRAGTERCHVHWSTLCNVSRKRHVTSSTVSLGHYIKDVLVHCECKTSALRFIDISNCTFNHAREPFRGYYRIGIYRRVVTNVDVSFRVRFVTEVVCVDKSYSAFSYPLNKHM